MIKTVTLKLDGTTYPISSYTASGISKGSLIKQYADSNGDKYLQPIKYVPYNIFHESNNSNHYYPTGISWSEDVDYIFTVEGNSSMTMYISLTKYTRSAAEYSYVGRIHMTPTSGTPADGQALSGQRVNTIYNYRAPIHSRGHLYRYTSGTVEVSGRYVTGSGTSFQSSGIAAGARIGFGTTDHTQVSQWYDIDYITSDTALGLTSSYPYSPTFSSHPAGTPYVIEELRLVFIAQRYNIRFIGQLMLVKGIHENVFGYKDIPEATNIDNIRAFYNLYPGTASPTFSTTFFRSLVLDEPESDSVHYCYALDRGTQSALVSEGYNVNLQVGIYKFNLRAPLNFISGTAAGMSYSQAYVSTSAYVANTNRLLTISNFGGGTWPFYYSGNLMTLGTPDHGPTKGQKTLFITTSDRILAVPAAHVDNNYDFVPRGTTERTHRNLGPGTPAQNWAMTNYTYISSSSIGGNHQSQYIPSIDAFICTYFANAVGNYPMTVEKFNQPSSKMFFQFIRYRSALSNVNAGEYYSANRDVIFFCEVNGIMHTLTGASFNSGYFFLYAIPLHADYDYASQKNQWVITPACDIPSGAKCLNVKLNTKNTTDDDSMRVPPGGTRIWTRTSGIDSNTGTWSRIPDNGDISGLTASRVQFAFAWEILSTTGVVPYAYSLDFTYEIDGPDRHYFASKEKSSVAANTFAFLQTQAFGGTIPNLRIRLYEFETDALLLDDSTEAKSQGTWQYSSNAGVSWATWSSAADNVGNYIRYTANSLPANVSIRPQITVGEKKDFVFNI